MKQQTLYLDYEGRMSSQPPFPGDTTALLRIDKIVAIHADGKWATVECLCCYPPNVRFRELPENWG